MPTDSLKAMVIGAFVRGLSMRDVESMCEKPGMGELPRSTICQDLRKRFGQFRRRDLYDIRSSPMTALALFAALLGDATPALIVTPLGSTK